MESLVTNHNVCMWGGGWESEENIVKMQKGIHLETNSTIAVNVLPLHSYNLQGPVLKNYSEWVL